MLGNLGLIRMALLERVNQLKSQGYVESQINQILQEEGISPREISDALAQSKIKTAVSQSPEGEMQPSIMQDNISTTTIPVPSQQSAPEEAPAPYPTPAYPPQPNYPAPYPTPDYPPQPNYPAPYPTPAYPQEEAYSEEGAYPEQNYPQEEYEGGYESPYYQQALDIDTVRDISRQITEESLTQLKNQVREIAKLKTELKFQIQNIDNRLKKIEEVISQLQSDILGKIGDYGEAISDISKEIKATQDSFAKVVEPLVESKKASKPTPNTSARKSQKSKSNKSSDGDSFEDYLR